MKSESSESIGHFIVSDKMSLKTVGDSPACPEMETATSNLLHQHHSSQIFSCLSHPDQDSSVLVSGSCPAYTLSTHKLLLAAASPFLRQLLADTQSDSLFILLPDFSSSTLKQLSQFLSTGEISCRSKSDYNSCHQLFDTLKLLPEHHKRRISSEVPKSSDDAENKVKESKVGCLKYDNNQWDDSDFIAPSPVQERKVKSRQSKSEINEEISYVCEICNNEFGNKSSYFNHMKTHIDDATKSVCDICGGNYKDDYTLKVHVQTQHLMLEKPFACEVCGDRFKTKGSLKIHNSKHEEERAFVCDECGFQTKNKWLLKAHLKTHQTVKDFQCPHCPKTFNFQFILDKHIRIHTNERPFPCATCGTSFVSGIHLRRHQKSVHKTVRDFVCNICSAPFKRLSELKRHIILHSNERPFECNVCGSTFKHREAGRRHSKAVHPGIIGSIAYKPTEAIGQLATFAIKKLSQEEVDEATFKSNTNQDTFPQGESRPTLFIKESNNQVCTKDSIIPSRPNNFIM